MGFQLFWPQNKKTKQACIEQVGGTYLRSFSLKVTAKALFFKALFLRWRPLGAGSGTGSSSTSPPTTMVVAAVVVVVDGSLLENFQSCKVKNDEGRGAALQLQALRAFFWATTHNGSWVVASGRVGPMSMAQLGEPNSITHIILYHIYRCPR